MPEALVICINYHNEQDTVGFVRSVLRQELSGPLEIVVVDNNDGELENRLLDSLAGESPRVEVVYPGRNLGYFGGAARGLRHYLEGRSLPEWVVVSNTDIEFPDRVFFARLAELHAGGGHAVIAPAILSSLSGRDQNPYMPRRPSAHRMPFYKWVFGNYLTYSAYYSAALVKKGASRLLSRSVGDRSSAGNKADTEEKEPGEIYAPHGSFLVFHRSYFDAGGDLDYGAFLYGEEVFVAETVRRLGLSVAYDPGLTVLHREHETTGLFKSRKIARLQRESSAYCADEFFRCAR